MIFLDSLSDAEFVTTFSGIYEHSDWVPRQVLGQRPFASIEAIRRAMRQAVDEASEAEKLTLLMAHPDLAGKLARAGDLTESSLREQVGLGLDRLSDAEFQIFSAMNDHYRKTFGFPFIICARRTTKEGVLKAFQDRVQNSRDDEIRIALAEVHQIASHRLDDLVG